MVDFGSKLKKKKEKKKIDPQEIFEHLDRSSDVGELRTIQKEVLAKWFNERYDDRDVVLKLHTGEGKTLIGLLMLQSKLNDTKKPALYLCPTKQLVNQTVDQAERFGIPYITFEEGEMPEEFIDSEKILITTCQKLFNGLTKFGINKASFDVGSVVLDDAHACVDIIKKAYKITVATNHDLYQRIIDIFEGTLRKQGAGTFEEILDGNYNELLPIPYWEWQSKYEEMTKILMEYNKDEKLKYTWPLIKDHIKYCTCVVSGGGLEIFLNQPLLEKFGSFNNAEMRVFMSATLSDDSSLIKDLNVSKSALMSPLKNAEKKWSGEKLVIFPESIAKDINHDAIVQWLTKKNTGFGICVLTPSFDVAKKWEVNHGKSIDSQNIISSVNRLKNGDFSNIMAFANRYDGIDLPDSSCRILVMDGKPKGESLEDRYYERVISNSNLLEQKCAQKIEQGFGRAVRGEKDYCCIMVLGKDLMKFLRSARTKSCFSYQTQTQIDIGFEVLSYTKKEMDLSKEKSLEVVRDVINQQLKRDENWKDFYEEQMNDAKLYDNTTKDLELFEIEAQAEKLFLKGDGTTAAFHIQKIIDSFYPLDDEMGGWYLQKKAQCLMLDDPAQGIRLQKIAYEKNPYLLLHPQNVVSRKLEMADIQRLDRMLRWINKNKDYDELMLEVNDNIANLTYGIDSEIFERAIESVGESLGFKSNRPEKIYKDGPDNLWQLSYNEFLVIECKNKVKEERTEVHKSESGQNHNSITWFEEQYSDAHFSPILIINATNEGYQTHLDPRVRIMNKTKLELLKTNYFNFFNSLSSINIKSLNEKILQEHINSHMLDVKSLQTKYSVKVK
ncbi:MAG: DEAD/DEAH box helicase family protein [Candidatus Delongbacteria bacterium]|nr:DEAD/DEAH box helicase family protein [Candidatus Delongbacteria bacterium]